MATEGNAMKFGFKYLRKHTPNALFRLGNALIAASLFGSLQLMKVHPEMAIIVLWCGIFGKFLTELFSEDKKS